MEVLKEIRDEVKGTNTRLDHTNARLDVTIMRLESLERRVDLGFEGTNARLSLLEGSLQFVEKSATKGFERVSESIRDMREKVTEAMKDHEAVVDHEHRIRALERQTS